VKKLFFLICLPLFFIQIAVADELHADYHVYAKKPDGQYYADFKVIAYKRDTPYAIFDQAHSRRSLSGKHYATLSLIELNKGYTIFFCKEIAGEKYITEAINIVPKTNEITIEVRGGEVATICGRSLRVPNLIGLYYKEACRKLEDMGLKCRINWNRYPRPPDKDRRSKDKLNKVEKQRPSPDSDISPGGTVDIQVVHFDR
jgi:hypothetical protein